LILIDRAMAGNKTISENYSFSGVHHIFDQHKAAGKLIYSVDAVNFESVSRRISK